MKRKNLPVLVFTDFQIFNKSVQVGTGGSPLQRPVSITNEIRLSYKESVFSVEFAALNYSYPGRNHYAYKMNGFDKDLNFVKDKRTATYTNLNPGQYILEVHSFMDGSCSQDGINLKITITPPFWKTIWFKILFLIIISGSVTLLYLYRISAIQKQKLLLEKKVKQRTSEIHEMNVILRKQTAELHETNQLLQERSQQIEEQADELLSQKENLEIMNKELNEVKCHKG
ncbi:MAG: hypothetical protein HC906_04430 [Bacteroidales bacterium]|nr:hypothetical protein [Bacteroidales bacterium]